MMVQGIWHPTQATTAWDQMNCFKVDYFPNRLRWPEPTPATTTGVGGERLCTVYGIPNRLRWPEPTPATTTGIGGSNELFQGGLLPNRLRWPEPRQLRRLAWWEKVRTVTFYVTNFQHISRDFFPISVAVMKLWKARLMVEM
jgi:hypothetical protein